MPVEVILGRRGSGKSTLLEKRIAKCGRLIVLDPHGEILSNKPPPVFSWEELRQKTERNFFRVCYVPSDFQTPQESLDPVCMLCEGLGNVTLAIDEADIFVGAQSVHTPPGLYRVVALGRHWDVDVILAARRQTTIPRTLTAEVETMYVFSMTEPRDQKWLDQVAGEGSGNKVRDLDAARYEYATFVLT